MSTIDERRARAEAGTYDASHNGFGTRVMLQPIAAPSILGLAGFAGATFIVASNLAGWYGTPKSPLALAPFAMMFGGLAAIAESIGLVAVLSPLATGSGILAGAFIYGSLGWAQAACWFLVFSAG